MTGCRHPNLDPTALSAKNALLPAVLRSVVRDKVEKETDRRIPSSREWREVDVGWGGGVGRGRILLKLKTSFLPVKTSSFDHANVWSPKLR